MKVPNSNENSPIDPTPIPPEPAQQLATEGQARSVADQVGSDQREAQRKYQVLVAALMERKCESAILSDFVTPYTADLMARAETRRDILRARNEALRLDFVERHFAESYEKSPVPQLDEYDITSVCQSLLHCGYMERNELYADRVSDEYLGALGRLLEYVSQPPWRLIPGYRLQQLLAMIAKYRTDPTDLKVMSLDPTKKTGDGAQNQPASKQAHRNPDNHASKVYAGHAAVLLAPKYESLPLVGFFPVYATYLQSRADTFSRQVRAHHELLRLSVFKVQCREFIEWYEPAAINEGEMLEACQTLAGSSLPGAVFCFPNRRYNGCMSAMGRLLKYLSGPPWDLISPERLRALLAAIASYRLDEPPCTLSILNHPKK